MCILLIIEWKRIRELLGNSSVLEQSQIVISDDKVVVDFKRNEIKNLLVDLKANCHKKIWKGFLKFI